MRTYIVTILFLLVSCQLFAQNDNVRLLAQSPDGHTVKLVWFFKNWSSDVTGFDIKRKEGLQDWTKLNKEPILPGISAKKKLSIVESDRMGEGATRGRLLKMLASHKLQETDYNTYLQNLNSDSKAAQEMARLFMEDYDLALMSGFAYVDHTITKKTGYEYGLFIQGTDKLIARTSWNYGQIPDLNVVLDVTSKSTLTGRGVQLIWNADTTKMKSANVAGFNIYREGIRLNTAPILQPSAGDPSEFAWYDRSMPAGDAAVYSISAESIFGIEGLIKPYTYNPADHPREYKKAEVTQINAQGFYFKDGIGVKWNFPKDYEHFIKGFYVEKDNMPKGYRRVSGLLGPSERGFSDKSPSPVSGYIRFRIVAVYNDRSQIQGTEKLYNYFPVGAPPTPQNVRAKVQKGESKAIVNLSWDAPIAGDSVTDFYRVYEMPPVEEHFRVISGDQLRTNKFTYLIDANNAGVFKFCVSSVGKGKTESQMSDTVIVQPQTAPTGMK